MDTPRTPVRTSSEAKHVSKQKEETWAETSSRDQAGTLARRNSTHCSFPYENGANTLERTRK